ncbi:MAG: class I SAM-dependent methyltransferase [Kiloniellaceae bacterium]
MARDDSQTALVERQFGAQAAAYVASPVHAAGPDLDWLTARVAALRPDMALDLGAGGGHVSYALAPYAGRVIACDLSPRMLAAVGEAAVARGLANIETRTCNVAALPFADGAADFAASRFSTHHWGDTAASLREARRVLADGSTAIFMDAVSPGRPLLDTWLQGIELLRDPSHVRDYASEEWIALLQAAGFALQRVQRFRLRLDFAAWIARIGTPAVQAEAILALQRQAPAEVAAHFDFADDGCFTLDTACFEVVAA